MVVAQKCLQHESVLAKSVGPEIPAHEVSRGAKLLFDERQRHLGHRGIRELFHGDGLGLLECLADVCRELILGNADALALQIRGSADATVGADINRGMAKGARGKYRRADVGAFTCRGLDGEGTKGKLAHVEFGVAKGPEENLLRL